MPNTEEKSKSQQIREYYLENPERGLKEASIKFSTSELYCNKLRKQVRKRLKYGIEKKQVKPIESKENSSTFDQKGDKAEYTFYTPVRIVSVDDLVDACDIDLSNWDIERMICNKWEVGAKDKEGVISVTPLFQVKVWLKPKTPNLIVDFIKNTIEEMKAYSPKYPIINRPLKKDPTLFMIDIADPHFGKYASKIETGEDYNIEIAAKRYKEGFDGLLDKGSHYDHEKIVIIGGNDAAHIDNPFNTTTAGTRQDTDKMWHEILERLKWANIAIIERAASVADVLYVHNMSNHDFMLGYCLAQILEAWFHNSPNVKFDVTPQHRKYIQYGRNLIGQTHGDGAKEIDLPSCMAVEAKKAFSVSDYLYWYCKHVHHKIRNIKEGKKHIQLEKDGKGICVINTGLNLEAKDKFNVEYVRSISGTDRWHSTNAFQHSFIAMEGFIHHPEFGQVNRLTHLF